MKEEYYPPPLGNISKGTLFNKNISLGRETTP